MPSLIDKTYFKGALTIAQTSQPSVVADLQNCIDTNESEFLQAALGYDLWNDFTTGLTAPSPDQKWLALKNGAQFTTINNWPSWYWGFEWLNQFWYLNSQRTAKWVGFASNIPPSPETAYIYTKYQEDLFSQTTGIGVVKQKGENSESHNPTVKIINAWNNMAKDIFILWQFLQSQGTDVYPSYDPTKIMFLFFKPRNIFSI